MCYFFFFLSTEWKDRWSVTFIFPAVIGWNRKTHVRCWKILLCLACSTSVFGPPQRPLCLNFALRPLSRHSLLLHHRWPLAKKGKVTENPGVLKIPSSVWNTRSKAEGAQITWEKNSEVGAGEMSLKAVARSVSRGGGGSWDLPPPPSSSLPLCIALSNLSD